ncbi:MAG: trehalose-phosphatase [Cytophagales bacterium]|nr:trehalose-phosphatase [Rhizobacter sp.]
MAGNDSIPLNKDSALFVDFDGTLADIAPRPDAVTLPAGVVELLARLHKQLDGALAVVSGRSIAQLDEFLTPLQLAAAGVHGAERRNASGVIGRFHEADLTHVVAGLEALAELHPGMLVETKPGAVALHYRLAPQCEALAQRAMDAALHESHGMALIHGKMVIEMKPAGASKGRAIRSFMGEAPFAGRRPVFAGDDSTDESGFAVVQAAGGLGIKVGAGATRANNRLDTPSDLRMWLQAAADQLSS